MSAGWMLCAITESDLITEESYLASRTVITKHGTRPRPANSAFSVTLMQILQTKLSV